MYLDVSPLESSMSGFQTGNKLCLDAWPPFSRRCYPRSPPTFQNDGVPWSFLRTAQSRCKFIRNLNFSTTSSVKDGGQAALSLRTVASEGIDDDKHPVFPTCAHCLGKRRIAVSLRFFTKYVREPCLSPLIIVTDNWMDKTNR